MTSIEQKNLATLNVFVLEDSDAVREKMVNDLKSLGIEGEIIQSDDLKGAFTILKQKPKVDIFICDWNLPDGEGIKLLEELKKTKRFCDTPFLMCTTRNEVSKILLAMRKGCSDYIVKPWDIDELKNKILTSLK